MKALLRIYNLTTHDDIINIRNVVSNYEGILACEINLNRKEVNVVYDGLSVSIDELMISIENAGYMVI
ncbi:MAG: heavy-metal-associated domain-containing protein [Clostridium celatum]|uniref:cation transporter n=1 Tax=uncultured Clostridium sp. TaxID=59620 RepID=UPI0025E9E904|nr:heavy-metal-associated domain-containing protein [uncultured Clostridium sp.]MDU4884799.1 heavy-metal-associated domain-containing protein [Clostridium celatum]MDU5261403.1 heavy-metal-associated domain-containing protein [Clostridium celatum]MDU7078037.1 heavy-metal-associated domain-containing protein [Clostridium celatum]